VRNIGAAPLTQNLQEQILTSPKGEGDPRQTPTHTSPSGEVEIALAISGEGLQRQCFM